MPCVDFSIGVEYSSKNEEDCNEFNDVQLVTDALRYAQGKGYHSDCSKNSKRSIRRKAKRFVVNNRDVHYRKKNGTLVSHPWKLNFVYPLLELDGVMTIIIKGLICIWNSKMTLVRRRFSLNVVVHVKCMLEQVSLIQSGNTSRKNLP